VLKGVCFQVQACLFVKTEQEVHILHCLTGGSFQQIVDGGVNHQLGTLLLQLDQAFVGVDHLLQRDSLPAKDGEGMAFVKCFV